MNRYCYVLILILFSGRAHTQSYHPIPEAGVIWQEYQFYTFIPCVYNTTLLYYFEGDTLITNVYYQKLFSESNTVQTCSGVPEPITTLYPKQYEGAFRQDSSLRQAYFIRKDDATEKLLYDFNLVEGDSLYFFADEFDIYSNPVVIQSVDSVMVEGTWRKRMLYLQEYDACGNTSSAVIEGIGNTRGVIYPKLFPCSVYKTLDCVSVNGVQFFGSGDTCYNTGEVGYSTIENLAQSDLLFELFYGLDGSPFIRYNIPDHHSAELRVMDVLGRMNQSYQLIASGSIPLENNQVSAGCHFLILFADGKLMTAQKILIR